MPYDSEGNFHQPEDPGGPPWGLVGTGILIAILIFPVIDNWDVIFK